MTFVAVVAFLEKRFLAAGAGDANRTIDGGKQGDVLQGFQKESHQTNLLVLTAVSR
jgi:hypothetical protein